MVSVCGLSGCGLKLCLATGDPLRCAVPIWRIAGPVLIRRSFKPGARIADQCRQPDLWASLARFGSRKADLPETPTI